MAEVNPEAASSAETARRRAAAGTRLALAVFGLIVAGGPLAFGAVDRLTQVGVLALFTVGLAARPAAVVPLGRWGNSLVLALLGVLVIKEFLPAAWFGGTEWRRVLAGEHGLVLPWTHHPEPSRALEALCSGMVATLWFLWVRTLAAERETRAQLAWMLLIAAAVVAAVSFATRGFDPQAIYGWRYTPGWTGFGPFPNRNHSACFFAMGLALGCGCVAYAGVRKAWAGMAAGIVLTALNFLALLATQSRGGLLAAAAGGACFLGLALWKVRTKRALALAATAVLLAGVLALVAGGEVFGRLQAQAASGAVDLQRVGIWKDALGMWRDAPLFGHGIGAFAQLFGIYQTVPLENSKILHPESSWLQWLTELGVVAVLLGIVGLVRFGTRHLRDAFSRRRSFFLRIGAFAAVAVLLLHGLIDVPGHRWGTLGFALAALAIACPLRFEGRLPVASRRAAIVPLALAIFWALPILGGWPAWSPFTLQRLLAREQTTGGVPLPALGEQLRYFPLSADLHQELGLRQVAILGRASPGVWQRHFAIANTLLPGAWSLPARQARAVEGVAPEVAVGYWQEAVERATLHRDEVFRTAVLETVRHPVARAAWARYAAAHPELLLAYAQLVPDAEAGPFFTLWWRERARTAALDPGELDAFYNHATQWVTRAQFEEWTTVRATWRARDFRRWAAVFEGFGEEERAFKLLAEFMPEPEFPKNVPGVPREQLEMRWRVTPTNFVNAQHLALARLQAGETALSEEIILKVAARDGAPPWFRHKAAYLRARQGRFGEAVAVLLRGP